MMPKPSRNHCTAAPAMKIEPSSAYCAGCPSICQAMVEITPGPLTDLVPVFITTKAPVP